MKNNSLSIRIFSIGIIVSAVIASPLVLDFTLTPRLIALASTIFLSLIFVYRSGFKTKIAIDLIMGLYLACSTFNTLSFFWANTKSEAIFEISKNLAAVFVFLFTYFGLKQEPVVFLNRILKTAIVIPWVGLIFALDQFRNIDLQVKESIYLITGINGHKNLYASFLFLNLFFLTLGYFKLPKPWKQLSICSFILSVAIIISLGTKAVWLGIIVTIAIFTALYSYKKLQLRLKVNFFVLLITCILSVNAFFLYFLQPIILKGITYNAGIKEKQKELDNERLVLWNKSIEMFKKHPVAGVGAGNWQIHFPNETLTGLWRAEDLNFTFQRPHNDLLWILDENGLIGFNLFLLFLFSLLLFLTKTLKLQTVDKSEALVIMLCVGFIVGFFTVSFFDFPKERIEHLMWINFIFAIAYYHIKKHNTVISTGKINISKPISLIAIILFSFVILTACLRYKGEYYTRELYDAKNEGNPGMVIENGRKAKSYVYSIDPTSIPVSWYTGNAFTLLKNFKEAQTDLNEALELNPYNRNVVNDLASAYSVNGKPALAKKYYLESSRISPRFDDPKLNLAALLIAEKNYQEALNCLDSIFHDSERRSRYQTMARALLNDSLAKLPH